MAKDVSENGTGKKSAAKDYYRLRLSIPKADVSTIAWLESQNSVSTSLRYIIREEIQKHGIIDVMCAPVEQQGMRGPKPKVIQDVSSDDMVNVDIEIEKPFVQPVQPQQQVASQPIVQNPGANRMTDISSMSFAPSQSATAGNASKLLDM